MKQAPLLVLIPIILVNLACGGQDQNVIEVTFDPCAALALQAAGDATPGELASLQEATAMWNQLGRTKLGIDSGAAEATLPVWFQTAAPAFLGSYSGDRGEVFINREIVGDRLRAVTIAHEIGHAFGLMHISKDVRFSVMNPGNPDVEPNEADNQALLDARTGCGSEPVRTR